MLNAKSKPVPAAWRPRFNEFLKKIGYRFVLRELTHPAASSAGESFVIRSRWDNVGVAPVYHAWPLAYRLRSGSDEVAAQWTSSTDLKQWLPGPLHRVEDRVVVPATVPAGTYMLDVGILSEDARSAVVDLAIEGKRTDRWYSVSRVEIR